MIQTEIIRDSIAPHAGRLTTFRLTYPRFIHSELMTHRVFSRNAASSRAIPFRKMVEMIEANVAMPEYWGSSQPGMQSGAEVADKEGAIAIWDAAMRDAVYHATRLDAMGVHKSISNRLLEPFAHMTTLVSATEWHNFFSLRAHKDAQPEFQILAYQMLEAYLTSSPKELIPGEWHLPLVDGVGMKLAPISTARCARVSYLNFKDSTEEEDRKLADRLSSAGHWSPFEHQATPTDRAGVWYGNFKGWVQYRKLFEQENRTELNLHEILAARP